MNVTAITIMANGNLEIEMALLEKEAATNSADAEIFIRLSQIYRLKKEYIKALAYLHNAEKIFVPIKLNT